MWVTGCSFGAVGNAVSDNPGQDDSSSHAERNTQLMCYGIAALGVYENLYGIKDVSLSIFQPRRENVQTWTVSVDELKNWAENELKPKVQMAAKGESQIHRKD